MKPQLLGPAGLSLAAVLVLCVIAPPEVLGSGLAGVALFAAVAAVATPAASAVTPASRWVWAAVPLILVAARIAIAPGEAVEPAVCVLLAAVAGISAAATDKKDEFFAWLIAALVVFAGGRALYEGFFGLEAWAASVRQSAPTGDAALAVLNRLEQGRPYAGFPTPAALGCFLIMAIPAVGAWALGKRGGPRAFGIAAAAVGACGLAATRSMSAMAALAFALALAALRGRMRPRLLALAAGAIGLALLFAGILRPDAVFVPGREDSPWRLRAGNVRIALEIAREHPLIGVGPGGYAEAFSQHRRPGDNESRHAHNLPAELAAEWGIPVGLLLSALFFWVFLGPLVAGAGDPGRPISGLAIGVAAFAIHNLADFTAFLPSLMVFAAVSRGLLARRVAPDVATSPARAAWVALAVAIAVVAASSGLAREALHEGRVAAAAADHATALRCALRAKRLAPWDADPPMLAAEARMAAGPEGAAEALLDAGRTVARAPSRAVARWVRARARTAAGDTTGAYADLVEAARLYPMRADYAAQRDAMAGALREASRGAPR